MLVAEREVDGELHLTESFRQIGSGMLAALGQASSPSTADAVEPVSPELVEQAFAALAPDPDSLVKHEHGWELRTRIAGDVVPVQLSIEQSDLVVRHTVVATVPAKSSAAESQEAAHHALCLNGHLRHARLAVRDDRLVAETRLHRRLVSAHWLRHSTGAVACAARYAWPTLRVLLHQQPVRQLYSWWLARAFTSNDENPAHK